MAEAAKRKENQLSDMMSRLDTKDKQMSDFIAQVTTWKNNSDGRRTNNNEEGAFRKFTQSA